MVMEVIVDNVDQEASFHELLDQLPRSGIVFVKLGPLCPKFICLVLIGMLEMAKSRSNVGDSLSKP